MLQTVFVCPAAKCAYAIAADTLNELQLKVLRRTRKNCPGCGTPQNFQEQATLPNIQIKTTTSYGGTGYEKTIKKTTRSATQRARASDGYNRH